jgi:glutamate dehydrogenase (NAD(P)+)
LSAATEVAAEFCKLDLAGARLAVQGFGSVGQHAARFLSQKGVVLVAVSDSRGTLSSRGGLDVERLIALKAAGGSVLDHDRGEKADGDALIGVDCDIWVPAARPDVLRADNVGRLKARLVVQGANIPATDEAEAILHQRGILSVPDFIANAGGVICASVEYHGGTQAGAMQSIDDRIRINTRACLSASRDGGQLPRQAALQIAEQRVRRAMACRRWSSRR